MSSFADLADDNSKTRSFGDFATKKGKSGKPSSFADLGTGTRATATASDAAQGTSKFKNLLAQIDDVLNGKAPAFRYFLPEGSKAPTPGQADALEQTGGNAGEAKALQRRALGLGAGLAAGAVTLPLAAPTTLAAGALTGAATGLASTLASVGAEGLVGGYSLSETVDMAKEQLPWGIGLGAAGGAIAGKLGRGQKVLNAAHILPESISSPAHIAASMGAGEELKFATAETKDLFKALKIETLETAKDARRASGRGQLIRFDDFKDLPPTVRAALIDEFIPDPNILEPGDKAIYAALQRAGGLPQKLTAGKAAASAEAQALADAVRETVQSELGGKAVTTLPDGTQVFRREAMSSARRAGWERARVMINDDYLAAKQLMAGLDTARKTANGLQGLFVSLEKKVVRSVKGYIEKTPSLFPAAIAKPLTKALDDFSLLYERSRGQWLEHNKQFVLKGLSKDEGVEFSKVVAGEITTSNPKVINAVKSWTRLWTTLGDFAEEAGLKLIDRRLTAQIRRMTRLSKAGLTKARLDKLNNAAETGVFDGLNVAERKLVLLLQGSDAKLTGDGKNIFGEVAFRRAKHPAPRMYAKSYLEQVGIPGTPEHAEALQHMIDGKMVRNKEEAATVLRQMFETSDDAPFDTRGGGLQWSKENLLPADRRVMDPEVWTSQYIDNAARRLAGAHTFGPKDELVTSVVELMKSVSPGKSKAATQGRDELMRVFRDLNGRGDGNHEGVKIARSLAASTFLGLKTVLLQMTQMSNAAGMFGSRNALVGSVLAMSPKNRQTVVELGPTLADVARHIMDEPIHDFVDNMWHVKLIKAVDADTRIRAATMAMLSTHEAAEDLVRARVGSGKFLEAQRILKYVGLDPEAIAQQGGKLTAEQLRNATQTGAHKTMFGNRSQDLPYIRTHAAGKFFMTLLTYAYRQSKYVVSDLLPEAKQGNFKPLLRFAAAIGLGSIPAAQWQAWTQHKDFKDVWIATVVSSSLGLLAKPYEVATNPMGSITDVPATSIIGRGIDAALHGDPARAMPNVLRGPWMPAPQK